MEKTLVELLALALPYVEDGADNPCLSGDGKKRARELARLMRRAIELHDE
jgi:hypothetical protein